MDQRNRLSSNRTMGHTFDTFNTGQEITCLHWLNFYLIRKRCWFTLYWSQLPRVNHTNCYLLQFLNHDVLKFRCVSDIYGNEMKDYDLNTQMISLVTHNISYNVQLLLLCRNRPTLKQLNSIPIHVYLCFQKWD